MEIERTYYTHDSNCSGENFEEPNLLGLKTCKDCAGIFDVNGNGICVTDKRLDWSAGLEG